MRILTWVQYVNGNNNKTQCQQFCVSDVLVNALHLGYGEIVPLNRKSNGLPTRGIGCSTYVYISKMIFEQIELKGPSIPGATSSVFLNDGVVPSKQN
jgi:hypothetical protein